MPDNNDSGFIIRGGIVGQGTSTSVLVARNLKTNRLEFIPRYAASNIYTVGLPEQTPTVDQQALFTLLPNSYVAVQHPSVIYCFTEVRRWQNSKDETVVEVEPLFPDGIFYGYYNNYEPSNKRPVLLLHDSSPFSSCRGQAGRFGTATADPAQNEKNQQEIGDRRRN